MKYGDDFGGAKSTDYAQFGWSGISGAEVVNANGLLSWFRSRQQSAPQAEPAPTEQTLPGGRNLFCTWFPRLCDTVTNAPAQASEAVGGILARGAWIILGLLVLAAALFAASRKG